MSDAPQPPPPSESRLALVFMSMAIGIPTLAIGTFLLTAMSCTSGGGGGGNLASADPATASTAQAQAPQDAGPLPVLRVERVGQADPFAAYWGQAEERVVAMLPQNITAPALYETSVSEARIQAVSDGQSIAWRISWRDPSPDVLTDTDVFPDAVALEFPTKPGSNVMMGLGGGKVQILQWKALWQHDVDYGFQDVQDLHPNFWNGVYWFTDSEWPHPITEAFDSPEAQLYQVAYRAGNPMSDWNRVNPCEEMVAEGFGTLTSQSDTVSTARGIWSWDSWSVVFVRPLTTDDPDDYQFTADADQQIALAIWQGAEENVGGRKHWSNWSPFDLGE